MGKKKSSSKKVDGFDQGGKEKSPMSAWAKAMKKGKYAKNGGKEPADGMKDPPKC